MTKYTNEQIRHLKSLAHELKPIVWVGQKGLSPSLVDNIKEGLRVHELIKIKFHEKEDLEAILETILKESGATHVQTMGKIVTIFKQNDENPKITP